MRIAGTELTSGFLYRLSNYQRGPGSLQSWTSRSVRADSVARSPKCSACGQVRTPRRNAPRDRQRRIRRARRLLRPPERQAVRSAGAAKPLRPLARAAFLHGTAQRTAWAYCATSPKSGLESVDRIEDVIEGQIELLSAPGFRDCILASRTAVPNWRVLADWNPNLIGGDVSGGVMTP